MRYDSEATMNTQFKHALILGKFMPVHNGHVYLIEMAEAKAEQLTIILFSEPTDPLPGALRLTWLKTLFPKSNLIHYQKPLPRDKTGYAHWDIWLDAVKACLQDTDIDAVFSSEDYGERLARDLEAIHILVDKSRTTVPISATQIREKPLDFLEHLPELVQSHFKNTAHH